MNGSPFYIVHLLTGNALFLLRDLNEIAAGVIKDGRGNGPHINRRLGEVNSR
jgi:hypothetical protein